jgi:Ca2+-binding RTX toxin-like protein
MHLLGQHFKERGMATVQGTEGDDDLIGTADDDLLISAGGHDRMSGGDGADTYNLTVYKGATSLVISDLGGDGAVDTITGASGLYQSGSYGYASWATVERIGDNLLLDLPGRPYRFRKPAHAPVSIEIVDHFAGDAVERIMLGTVTYTLASGALGSDLNDILAGTSGADVLYGYGGNDFVCANDGDDTVRAGDGDDIVFGGEGRNLLALGQGSDRAWGGSGRDVVRAGGGNDTVDAGEGNNKVIVGKGDDRVTAGAGDDIIKGGSGNDHLTAGDGDNRVHGGAGGDTLVVGVGKSFLSGGKAGDLYVVSVAGAGEVTIADKGEAASASFYATGTFDILNFTGYDDYEGLLHGLQIGFSGKDLVFTYSGPETGAGAAVVTVRDHFRGAAFEVEAVGFGSTRSYTFNIAHLHGDNRTYSVHYGADAGFNDIVLGTKGGDKIYGGGGRNILAGGDGADRFLYEFQGDNPLPEDLILDFDLSEDMIDFTELGTRESVRVDIADNAYGNAVISTDHGSIELRGISADQIDITHRMFVFDGSDAAAPADPLILA